MITDKSTLRKLMTSFPGSFINGNLEFIAEPKTNQYFLLEDCETERDVKAKVIEWLSRSACKTQPYDSPAKNVKFNKFMRDCINNYLSTSFNEEEFMQIYQEFGNAVNHKKTLEFVDCLEKAVFLNGTGKKLKGKDDDYER